VSPLFLLAVAALVLVAFANGANDNGKGVATLIGSRALPERRAILLALLATLAGSLAAVAWGAALLARFGGKGLVPDETAAEPAFALAAALGAAGAVLLATRFGFPVSTTHALVGGLVGAGLVRSNGGILLGGLGEGFVLPLLASPLVAAVLAGGLAPLLRRLRASSPAGDPCVCVEAVPRPGPGRKGTDALAVAAAPSIYLGSAEACAPPRSGLLAIVLPLARLRERAVAGAHLLSAAVLSFARGLNDAPKIAAIGVAAAGLGGASSTVSVAAAMAAGGWLAVRRVTRTMSHEITRIGEREGLAANLVASALVLGASRLGLPVSTTHVTCGSLFGLGTESGSLRVRMVLRILAAWVTTLPLAAALAALVAAALPAGAGVQV